MTKELKAKYLKVLRKNGKLSIYAKQGNDSFHNISDDGHINCEIICDWKYRNHVARLFNKQPFAMFRDRYTRPLYAIFTRRYDKVAEVFQKWKP